MEQTEKKQLHYKKIENISAYVQKLAKEGANLIIAKKWTRIMARKGTPGEKVISWSVAADGDLHAGGDRDRRSSDSRHFSLSLLTTRRPGLHRRHAARGQPCRS